MSNGNKYGPRPPKVPVYRRLVHLKREFDDMITQLGSQPLTVEMLDIIHRAEHRAQAVYRGDEPQKDRK